MVNVSIVIRCYNEEKHIGRLLTGIMQQTQKDVEVIVVDSGSTDATLSIASRYPTKILSISREDFSFGHSLNTGCEAAKGEFIVTASAHVYPVFKDWLERLLAPFSDTLTGLVYGKQRGNENSKYPEHQIFTKWFSDESNPNQDHPFCNNANAAIRHRIWRQLPYNEGLTGLEDIDWANRAMRMDYRIAYAADAEVVHVHDETPTQIFNRYRREAIALNCIFPDEHFHFGDLVRLFLTNVLSDYGHAVRDRVFGREWFGILRFRLMQFCGTYRGFAQRGPVTSRLKQAFYYPHGGQQQSKVGLPDEGGRLLVNYRTEERLYREHD